MTSAPKRVRIDVDASGPRPILCLWSGSGTTDTFNIHGGSGCSSAYLHVSTAHAAREYAQALIGCADALVEWAEKQEAAANAASDPRPDYIKHGAAEVPGAYPEARALEAGLDMLAKAGIKAEVLA